MSLFAPIALALLLSAAGAFAVEPKAESGLPYPPPLITEAFVPALTAPRAVAVEGRYFLPLPEAPFEVYLGRQKVKATRESDRKIVIPVEEIAALFRQLGAAPEKKFPLKVRVAGEWSNTVWLATVNTSPGEIRGEVRVGKTSVVFSGATVELSGEGRQSEVSASGEFVFANVPPGHHELVLHWKASGDAVHTALDLAPGRHVAAVLKVQLPVAAVERIVPDTLKEPSPVLVKGKNFLESAKAPFQVKIDGMAVKALRAREDAIQIPSSSLAPFFRKINEHTGRRPVKVTVTIAGHTTQAAELTLVRLSTKRDVAGDEP